MGLNVEKINIGGNQWLKYKGKEGQDVYVAMFMIDQNKLLGKFVDESSYDLLVDEDADFYLPPARDVTKDTASLETLIESLTEADIAFKFRKNVFTEAEQDGAFEGLYSAAIESNNRGMAAGPREDKSGGRDWVTPFQREILDYYIASQPPTLDGSDQIEEIIKKHEIQQEETRGSVWLRSHVEKEFGTYDFFDIAMERLAKITIPNAKKYAETLTSTKFISATSYASPMWSGISGFYGRYPRIPYGRATSHVEQNRETFEKCYPFARKLDTVFSNILPNRYAAQKTFSDKMDKKFLIGEDTTFTTITVNTTESDRNARCACHRDAGSLNEGYSNLTVITKDGKNWKGGYLVTPEVRAAINVRPGDLLLVDNMRVIHANTPIEAPDSGDKDMLRMSLIFYFREDMAQLGTYEYETLRRKFVDDRRLNKEHKLWKPFWNGVSPSMWKSQEWYDYLEDDNGMEFLEKYHPQALVKSSSLGSFF
jgi:hypothetical protein